MYYVEFVNENNKVISRGLMSSLPLRGNFVSNHDELFRVSAITFYSKENVLEDLNGDIYVRAEVDSLGKPWTKLEKLIYRLILVLWVLVIAFGAYTIYLRFRPAPPIIINPGIERSIKPPVMLAPPYHTPTPPLEDDDEPPKPKGMAI